MTPCKKKAMDKSTPRGAILEQLEKTKASIRAKVEHPFRVIRWQFGYVKVKYRRLAKNTVNVVAVCAVQPVDGAKTAFEYQATGMIALANGQRAGSGAEIGPQTRPERLKLSSFEKSCPIASFSGCCADHP